MLGRPAVGFVEGGRCAPRFARAALGNDGGLSSLELTAGPAARIGESCRAMDCLWIVMGWCRAPRLICVEGGGGGDLHGQDEEGVPVLVGPMLLERFGANALERRGDEDLVSQHDGLNELVSLLRV